MAVYTSRYWANSEHILYMDHEDARGLVTIYFVNGTKLELDELNSAEARSDTSMQVNAQQVEFENERLAMELNRAHLKDHACED